ncbi:MAG: ABC transporter ATP-binding protein [Candidatus Bathyarchaeota archaeon]|nr:ABC transporter ATP-binding protein [Candidatus Bathyarchaeota archaeon]
MLEIQDLRTYYFTPEGFVKAVDGVSLKVAKAETIGIVGESGCGKTTLAYSILKLLPPAGKIVDGHIYYDGRDLIALKEDEMKKIRWKEISMIFQGAMDAFNPVIKVGRQIEEAIRIHETISKALIMKRIEELFELVNLEKKCIDNFPYELSGGMRQRAMIAMALACHPRLLIADEPTTALDVTVQLQILNLLKRLKSSLNLSVIFITHNLSVIAEICDKLGVMYAGHLVEYGEVTSIFARPLHPYTKGLLEAIITMSKTKEKTLFSISGVLPDLLNPPPGCRFYARCPLSRPICKKELPPIKLVNGTNVACHFLDKIKEISGKELYKCT